MNQELIETLNKILPVVERVHGEAHPELHEVVVLYQELLKTPSKEIFEKLRKVTHNYTLPEDACPAYTKTYQSLEKLDKEFA